MTMPDDNEFEKLKAANRNAYMQPGANQVYTERVLDFKDPNSKGTVSEIKFDSIHIMRISLMISAETSIPFIANSPTVILFFSLQGDSVLDTDYVKNLNLKASSHNIIYMSPSKGKIKCNCGKYEVFYIGMSPEMFKTYFPRGEEIFERFNERMNQSDFSLLREEHGVINHRILKAIEDISRSGDNLSIKEIFLKAKVIELLSFQLGELCAICNPLPTVRPGDAEKMYEVRRFILEHLNENHSLSELAQIVGTNEYTLKKEFKELFGTTVFGFWSDAKMENAQKLLAGTKSDIKEISEIIGYKNPQHFTTAFKRKFGLTPSRFRKNHE